MLAAHSRSGLRYWATLCYAPEDELWARWLNRALKVYRVPKSLIGTQRATGLFPRRLFPVFLAGHPPPPAAPDDAPVVRALRDSRYLIVICSPAAAAAPEVDRQIRCFKSLGHEEHVLAFIVAGAPGDAVGSEASLLSSLPRALRYRVNSNREITEDPAHPVVADARRRINGKQTAFLLLVGGMIGATYKELRRCEFDRAKRRIQLMIASSLILAAVLCALGAQWYYNKLQTIQDQEVAGMKGMLDERAKRRAEQKKQTNAVEVGREPRSTKPPEPAPAKPKTSRKPAAKQVE